MAGAYSTEQLRQGASAEVKCLLYEHGQQTGFVCFGTLGYVRHVQVANFLNRLVDLRLQERGDLATKEGVIEDESANVVFATIFDKKIAPVGELVAEVHLPQLSNFSNDSFGVLLDPLGPNRGPVADMIMRHRRVISESHLSILNCTGVLFQQFSIK
jgi:hypothetical protein